MVSHLARLRIIQQIGILSAEMKSLTIELKRGAQRQLRSVAWKTKGDNCRRRFYALDQTDKPVVVTPKPAIPRYYVLGSPAIFYDEPFPEAVCIEISPCRLLAPPCYRTQEELDGAFPGLHQFEPWQWVYWQTHKQFLILEPADTAPLQERMDKWLAAMRAAYENESRAYRAEIERLKTKPLRDLGFKNEKQRKARILELKAVLDNIIESETPIGDAVCKGRLRLTLDDVKNGHEGIRDAWKHQDWANKNGEDLGKMAHERRVFCRWLEARTGTQATIIDATRRVPDPIDPSKSKPTAYPGISPPHFGEKFENNPQFLEACASVRYRARFADNANTVVYLSDCEVREELTAKELDEVAHLRGVVDLQDAKEPPPWHSEDFREIYLHDRDGKLKDTARPTNSLRALCLLLATHVKKPMPYTAIEPKIGALACQLDKDDNVENASNVTSHQIRDLVNRSVAGKKLKRWGVLKLTGTRSKYITLAPPSLNLIAVKKRGR
jgi:hypothetical protein